jgi:hypothetical protein
MSKGMIWSLFGIGFFIFLIGIVFGKAIIWFIGLAFIAAGLYLGLEPHGILRKDQVLENWAILIEKAQGKEGDIFQDTEVFIKESKAPSIEMDIQAIAPGMVRGLLGKTREFLIITDRESFKLKPYKIFINARDYGDNLDVSWYLTYKPTLLQAILSLLPFVNVIPKTLSDLDLFDQQDLRAYVTNAHHCLLKAVDKLMLDLNQDPSKIDRKSRGFLGIS